MSKALEDIAAERRRQIEAEGWTAEHDDQHRQGEMSLAAACYALEATQDNVFHERGRSFHERVPVTWPRSWAFKWWKPKDRRQNLVRAGALIAAEIERLDRAAGPQTDGGEHG